MTHPAQTPAHSKWHLIFALCMVGVALLIEGIVSPSALLTTLIDSIAAFFVFAPATLLGTALLRFFCLPPLPARWTFLFSASLGLGALSLLVLLGGVLGVLHRPVWIAVLAGSAALGVPVLQRMRALDRGKPELRMLLPWVAAIPFLALAVLAASNAPGLIWREEGFGYDVLEYHLQLPREYLRSGQITYLPHNVYANFPAGVEMLYLLTMVVQNNATDAGTTANMIHLGFAVLSVLAAWAIGRDLSPLAGIIGGLVVATCTWLEYLSGLAYVENAMIFYGLCATAALIRAGDVGQRAAMGRWAVLAGAAAGFSASCKYTAVPMFIAPLAFLALLLQRGARNGISAASMFCLASFLALTPWLGKNWAWTGNPVFPLANDYFDANPPGWSMEQTRQWERGHSPGQDVKLSTQCSEFWAKVLADSEQRFGPALWIVALAGLAARRRDRTDLGLVVFLLAQVCIWLFATHLYSRFAVPLIVPLAVLAGRATGPSPGWRNLAVVGFVLAGSIWNLTFAAMRHARESMPGAPASLFEKGELPGFEYLGYVNSELPAGSRLLLIGDARPFYVQPPVDYFVAFNHNPFLALIAEGAPPPRIVDWLRAGGYTHLLIHWSEIRRLERTYGLSPNVTEERLAAAVQELAPLGLNPAQSFAHPSGAAGPYVDVFEVIPPSRRSD